MTLAIVAAAASQRKIFLYYLAGVKSTGKRAARIAESVRRLANGAKHPRE